MQISVSSPLVLGSASPRRRELLAIAGVPFVLRAASINESPRSGEAPAVYLDRICAGKLDAVRVRAGESRVADPSTDRGRGDVRAWGVLVADTVVVAPDGTMFGKPRDDAETTAMMSRLAGSSHDVSTRFVLAADVPGSDPVHAETVTTRVVFRAISDVEIRAYAATGEGRDKAGGYGIQGRAAAFVRRIEGSYTNVVGLPLCEVIVALQGLGWIGAR